VVLHRFAADEQLGRDLRIGQALADQVGDLGLAAGQRQRRLLLARRVAGQMARGQLLLGPGDERRRAQAQVQVAGPAQLLDRVLPVPGAPQQLSVGQPEPAGVYRAAGLGPLRAAPVDPQRLLRVAALFGQPAVQQPNRAVRMRTGEPSWGGELGSFSRDCVLGSGDSRSIHKNNR
jgi:hypothetical protein